MHPACRFVKYTQDVNKTHLLTDLYVVKRAPVCNIDYDIDKASDLEGALSSLTKTLLKNLWIRQGVMCMLLQHRPIEFIQRAMKLSGAEPQPYENLELFKYFFWDVDLLEPSELDEVLENLPDDFDKTFLMGCFYHPSVAVLYQERWLPPVEDDVLIDGVLSLAYKKLIDVKEQDEAKLTDLVKLINQLVKLKGQIGKKEQSLVDFLAKLEIELVDAKDKERGEIDV